MSVPAIASRARADRISADENTIPDRRAAGPSGRPREMSKGTQALLAARDQALAQAKRLRAEQSTSVQAPDVRSDGQKRMDLFFSAANAAYRVDGHDVRVTCLFPSTVATDMARRGGFLKDADKAIRPEDVAEAVLGLLRLDARVLPVSLELWQTNP